VRITVNLASHPFVELRPVYGRLRTWILILALVGVALWYLYRNERAQAVATEAQVSAVENHIRDLEHQQQKYQAMMQEPKDAAILKQSAFLNGLFRRKAFSWTATMTDLETVLPPGVQVMSIDPIVEPDGHVTIRLRVTGGRDRTLDLIRNLEKSKHFASPRLASETLASGQGPQNVSTGDVNFDILADYRPLPLEANKPETSAATAKVKPHVRMEGQSTP
jgi:type IV pilus assembly protein PilN